MAWYGSLDHKITNSVGHLLETKIQEWFRMIFNVFFSNLMNLYRQLMDFIYFCHGLLGFWSFLRPKSRTWWTFVHLGKIGVGRFCHFSHFNSTNPNSETCWHSLAPFVHGIPQNRRWISQERDLRHWNAEERKKILHIRGCGACDIHEG